MRDTHNSGWEDLSCHDVWCDGMTKRPSKGIDVNEDDADNATGRCSGYFLAIPLARISETDVEGEIEHGRSLHGCADQKGQASSNTAK